MGDASGVAAAAAVGREAPATSPVRGRRPRGGLRGLPPLRELPVGERLLAQGAEGRLRYGVHAFDADAIPTQLQPASLDLIVCRNVPPSIDRQRFLADARRWLRPGGQLYVLVRVWSERSGEPHERPWQRGFAEEQVQDLQNGWAEQERCWLGRHTALFLSGERHRTL
jgi:SAM-dependent methyltransferase